MSAFGAVPDAGGTRFRVWAPDARTLDVVLEADGTRVPMAPAPGGMREAFVPGVRAGDRYRLSLDGGRPLPDPASRFQPDGVHGPSEVVDPSAFAWSDGAWRGVPLAELVLYELHVGTFTPEGTFAAAARRLPELRALGVTAVELMPVADFPGNRNWGYDGAALFAPARCYGTPDEMRAFVDAAHAHGLAVHLDVVYNHLGPDGAYAPAFSRHVFSARHRSPWGRGLDFDGPQAAGLRAFLVANAAHWIAEYHLDGLRLDATHAIVDDSARHVLAEIGDVARAAGPGREVTVVAEDLRNLARLVEPESAGGHGLDALWVDDFHYELRRLLTGDRDGDLARYRGDVRDLAAIVRSGWHAAGPAAPGGAPRRGSDPAGLAPRRFVFYLQNHDQVGNRALGQRLHHEVAPEVFRAAVALLLCAPQVPLLFMGQEWAAGTPFRFFTDHAPELGRRVREGRLREFRRYASFADVERRGLFPDPQDAATFEGSRLRWEEREAEPHASMLRWHRALLELRRASPALRDARAGAHEVAPLDAGTLALRRESAAGAPLVLVARLAGAGEVGLPAAWLRGAPPDDWSPVLGSEDAPFAPGDARPVTLEPGADGPRVAFARPGAVLLAPR